MKLGIMQPYFFPYLGYFDLVNNVDMFVLYDTAQYIKQGWINRNRILHPNKSGWQYISASLDRTSFYNSYQTPIVDVKTTSTKPWKQHILGQLAHYEKKAPYVRETISFVNGCLSLEEISISRLNVFILEQCTKLLNINFEYRYSSELDIEADVTHNAEERILDLCEFLGAKEYVNLPGGVDLYQPEEFKRRNIKLTFRNLPAFVYDTGRYAFEPNLSIIDLLMWNNPKVINTYLNEHQSTGKK